MKLLSEVAFYSQIICKMSNRAVCGRDASNSDEAYRISIIDDEIQELSSFARVNFNFVHTAPPILPDFSKVKYRRFPSMWTLLRLRFQIISTRTPVEPLR